MMRIIWIVIILVGFYFLAEAFIKIRRILPAYHSKELCSCLFVNHQNRDYCDALVKQWLPIGQVVVNSEKKTVEATFVRASRVSRFVDERFGCRLDPL